MSKKETDPNGLSKKLENSVTIKEQSVIFKKGLNFSDDKIDVENDGLIVDNYETYKMSPFTINQKSGTDISMEEDTKKIEEDKIDTFDCKEGISDTEINEPPQNKVFVEKGDSEDEGVDMSYDEIENPDSLDIGESTAVDPRPNDYKNEVGFVEENAVKEALEKKTGDDLAYTDSIGHGIDSPNNETSKTDIMSHVLGNGDLEQGFEKESSDLSAISITTDITVENKTIETTDEHLNPLKITSDNDDHVDIVNIENPNSFGETNEIKSDIQRYMIEHQGVDFNIIKLDKDVVVEDDYSNILLFIDDDISIKDINNDAFVGLDIMQKKSKFYVTLGVKKYYVQKLYFKEDLSLLNVIELIFEEKVDVGEFMNNYKIILFNGIVVHPLKKFSNIRNTKEFVLVTNQGFKNLDIDDSFLRNINLKGLLNLGNTCFMNTSLQCILNCKEFIDFFATHSYNDDFFRKKSATVSLAFCDLVNDLYNKKENVATPIKLQIELGKKIAIYKERNEQDAAEFINDFLDSIHSELNHPRSNIPESVEGYEKWKALNNSIVTDSFFSKIKSSIVCTNCDKSRYIYEPSVVLSLPIPEEQSYFTDIILFYNSPQRIPLKIFSDDRLTVSELHDHIKAEYTTSENLLLAMDDEKYGLAALDPLMPIKRVGYTIFCYEYDRSTLDQYYWIDLKIDKFFYSSDFGIKFYIKMERYDENLLFELLISRLTPFVDISKLNLLHSGINTHFKIANVRRNFPVDNILNAHRVKVEMSYWAYKKIFGASFSPKSHIISLISNQISIYDCINLFQEKEFIYGDCKILCDHCKQYAVAYKKLDIYDPAKYLIIQLKRFKYTRTRVEKIKSYVDFPLDDIIIGHCKYRVIAISNHISPTNTASSLYGLRSEGHYTAYVRKNTWYYCNDESVKPVKDVKKDDAYVFFLEKV